MSDKDHTLEPTKMDVNKFRRSNINTTVEQSTPDQFGQSYNADYDKSKWSDMTPALSRKLHQRSDVDMSPRSLHHTLGIKHNQASPGDHDHTGSTGKKIGPLEMDPVNLGKTRAQWTLPASPTTAQLVTFLQQFCNVRIV